jgi:recombination protein RecT
MVEKTLAKKEGLKEFISSPEAKKQFKLALPRHLTPDRFVRIALTAINRTPKLLQCTKESLASCLMDLSQLGLEPDGRKAHLIPYGDKCTLIVDYKGLVDLARRSREIADIHADIVCENDKFTYSFGTNGELVHKPAFKNKGKPIAAYSFVKLKDGSCSYEVMNSDDIEAIRKRSKAKDNGPWKTDWPEMAKKTVFRRHSKWLPVSSERFDLAINKDFDAPIDITVSPDEPAGKPEVSMPEKKKEEKPNAFKQMLDRFAEQKARLGDDVYYRFLGNEGFEHSNQIRSIEKGGLILEAMRKAEK